MAILMVYMPHDNAGLISMLGGDAAAIAKIDQVFDAKVDEKIYAHMEDISGLIGHLCPRYNEPSHHVAYLYNHFGALWKTQARLQQIVDSHIKRRPIFSGNDDFGTDVGVVGIHVLALPSCSGSNEYVIGRPFVDKAVLQLLNGKRFNDTR